MNAAYHNIIVVCFVGYLDKCESSAVKRQHDSRRVYTHVQSDVVRRLLSQPALSSAPGRTVQLTWGMRVSLVEGAQARWFAGDESNGGGRERRSTCPQLPALPVRARGERKLNTCAGKPANSVAVSVDRRVRDSREVPGDRLLRQLELER